MYSPLSYFKTCDMIKISSMRAAWRDVCVVTLWQETNEVREPPIDTFPRSGFAGKSVAHIPCSLDSWLINYDTCNQAHVQLLRYNSIPSYKSRLTSTFRSIRKRRQACRMFFSATTTRQWQTSASFLHLNFEVFSSCVGCNVIIKLFVSIFSIFSPPARCVTRS